MEGILRVKYMSDVHPIVEALIRNDYTVTILPVYENAYSGNKFLYYQITYIKQIMAE